MVLESEIIVSHLSWPYFQNGDGDSVTWETMWIVHAALFLALLID